MPLIILLLEANKSNHFRQKLPKIWATRTTEKENENIWWYYTSDNHFDFNRSWGMNWERRREGLSLSVSVVTGAKWERGFDLSHPTSFHISTSEKKTRKKQTQRKRGGSRNHLWSGWQPVEAVRVDADASVILPNNKVSALMVTKRDRGRRRELKNVIGTCSLVGGHFHDLNSTLACFQLSIMNSWKTDCSESLDCIMNTCNSCSLSLN